MDNQSKSIQQTRGEHEKPLKPFVLADDLWETGIARHIITRTGGNGDETCRVHTDLDENAGEACVDSFGKPEVLEKLDRAFKMGQFKHRMHNIKRYPSDPDFPIQAAQRVMGPHIARTLKSWRERHGGLLPPPPLEEEVVQLEEVFEERLTQFFGRDKNPG